jgi:ribosome-associated protein
LRIEVEKALDSANAPIVGMEIPQDSGWMVIDAFDVMVHLFTTDQRERYALENLWKDATEVSVSKLLAVPKKQKPTVRKKAETEKPKKPTKSRTKKSKSGGN